MSDGINDLVTEPSGNKPGLFPHPDKSSRLALYQTRRSIFEDIIRGQTVNTDQFAFIHFNVITLYAGPRELPHPHRDTRAFVDEYNS